MIPTGGLAKIPREGSVVLQIGMTSLNALITDGDRHSGAIESIHPGTGDVGVETRVIWVRGYLILEIPLPGITGSTSGIRPRPEEGGIIQCEGGVDVLGMKAR